MRQDTLTTEERGRLVVLRDEIATGTRVKGHLDGPDVERMAYYRMLDTDLDCTCGRSDGDECHCRDGP